MCKSIQIFSLGVKHGLYPGAPSESETQFIIDVRHVIPDPYHMANLKKPGTDPEVIKFVKKNIKDWLLTTMKYIKFELMNWLESDNKVEKTLKLYFTCTGGWQRSVVIANIVAERIRLILKKHPLSESFTDILITVEHLTMELTRTQIEKENK